MSEAGKQKRGFAAMSREMNREIARRGGKNAHANGKAHRFTSEEAREAGRKGGRNANERGRAHRFTSEEAAAAGRKGGLKSAEKKKKTVEESPAQEETP